MSVYMYVYMYFQPNLPPCLGTPNIEILSASILAYLKASHPQFSEPPGFWLRCAAWCKLAALLDGIFQSSSTGHPGLILSEHQNFRPRPTPTPKLNQNSAKNSNSYSLFVLFSTILTSIYPQRSTS
ncbi:hypothetical protein EJ02DRAFT_223440 [Clathrospora elynae]|uniref:Uncharacterized protein n=1 Tax=Clathrospora elynae TaxID=706981 RepID=A0A6A5SJD3_9PLEO|nr:hypothetical protein EJ02DRAFT_223440 [Clathrospora elynae]